jgi:hypothetical protein
MAFRIQIRRDISAKWSLNNPILLEGEIGYETNTTYMKIGDGVTPWNNLSYWQGGLTGAGLVVKQNGTTIQSPTSNLNFSNDFVVVSGTNYTATVGLASSPSGTSLNIFEDGVEGLTGATGLNFTGRPGAVTTDGKVANINLLDPYNSYFSVTVLLSGGNFSAFTSSRGPDGNALTGSPWNFTLSNTGNNITVTHNTGGKPMSLSTYGTNGTNVFIKSPNGTSTGAFSLASNLASSAFTVYGVNQSNTGADAAGTVEIAWTFGATA